MIKNTSLYRLTTSANLSYILKNCAFIALNHPKIIYKI